jgi:hypothetical protein
MWHRQCVVYLDVEPLVVYVARAFRQRFVVV